MTNVQMYRQVVWIDRQGRRCVNHVKWNKTAREIVTRPDFQCWFKYDDGTRDFAQQNKAMKVVARLWRRWSRYEKGPVRNLNSPSVIRNRGYQT
jgi:hypothetical protein